MSLPIQIISSNGTSAGATVTKNGQLVTAPVAYDQVKTVSMNVNDAGFTFFVPRVGEQFVITAMLLTADKNVSTDCLVEVFESTGEASNSVSESILAIEMLKNSSRDITGLNFLVSEGVYVNGKTDDNNVSATIMGYYINKL